jgi:ribosomal protein S18 acetylase RimI-like enzyme
VLDESTRQVFGQLTAVSFGLPYSSASDIYEAEEPWQGDFLGFVGYVKGTPVCTAGTIISGDAIGFYSIGTLPEHRRRGYAEALIRDAFEITRGDREIQRAVLQSTTAGERLYYQMGFRQVTRFSIYVSP